MSAIKEHYHDEIKAGQRQHITPEVDKLRMDQAAMPDEVLLQKCQKWISDLCRTGAKCWSLRVPPDPEHDPDLLFGELCRRFDKLNKIEEELSNRARAISYDEKVEVLKISCNITPADVLIAADKYMGHVGEVADKRFIHGDFVNGAKWAISHYKVEVE